MNPDSVLMNSQTESSARAKLRLQESSRASPVHGEVATRNRSTARIYEDRNHRPSAESQNSVAHALP